jgi:hypothetical protein
MLLSDVSHLAQKTTIPWRTDRSILKVIVMLFGPDKLVLGLQNWLYRLSSVRNNLHIAEFFEPIFAEFNSNP